MLTLSLTCSRTDGYLSQSEFCGVLAGLGIHTRVLVPLAKRSPRSLARCSPPHGYRPCQTVVLVWLHSQSYQAPDFFLFSGIGGFCNFFSFSAIKVNSTSAGSCRTISTLDGSSTVTGKVIVPGPCPFASTKTSPLAMLSF